MLKKNASNNKLTWYGPDQRGGDGYLDLNHLSLSQNEALRSN